MASVRENRVRGRPIGALGCRKKKIDILIITCIRMAWDITTSRFFF